MALVTDIDEKNCLSLSTSGLLKSPMIIGIEFLGNNLPIVNPSTSQSAELSILHFILNTQSPYLFSFMCIPHLGILPVIPAQTAASTPSELPIAPNIELLMTTLLDSVVT